jgi:hypothetical protein
VQPAELYFGEGFALNNRKILILVPGGGLEPPRLD